ncbi:MAG TPA: hypothetical protein PKW80_14640 [Bacteroidales bacterium]|nr:hypothetical protein [Bacteroidales bacterium]
MKNILIFALVALISAGLFISCEKKTIDRGSYNQPFNPYHTDSVRFSADIIPIFTASCLSCHAQGFSNPILDAGVAYTNLTATPGQYINLADPPSSVLYTTIVSTQSVHGSGPYTVEGAKILTWIQQGAKNN